MGDDEIARPSEREEVMAWLEGALDFRLHRVDAKPKGRTVYTYWEPDSGSWHIQHKFRADQLRWRYMRELAFREIPELRDAAWKLWEDYLARRPAQLRRALAAQETADER